MTAPEWDDDDDRYEEFKDARAMGYIDADGNQLDPEPPDDDWIGDAS